MLSNNYIIEFSHISKNFGGVHALNDVSFGIKQNQVHAIVGENGAGKSTLMNLLAGVFSPTRGQILLNDKSIKINNIRQAQALGIGIIFQELNLCSNLTVAQNIFLGREFRSANLFVNRLATYKESKRYLDLLGVELNPSNRIRELSVAKQQMVEIAKAFSLGAKVLIMDEPNSALNEQETEILFNLINSLKAKGATIIYVSHKMSEVFRIADQITVLRDGHYVSTLEKDKTSIDQIVRMMVGRSISNILPEAGNERGVGDAILRVSNFSKRGKFEDINFSIFRGEIVGFAGLAGAGRQLVARAIFGLDMFDSGEIFVDGKKVMIKSPNQAIRLGLGFVTSDRREEGILARMSVKQNITLTKLRELTRFGFLNKTKIDNLTNNYIDKLNIKTPDLNTKIENLSGGNQQKVILSRSMAANPKVLILDEPTRGIDVGTKAEILKILRKLTTDGLGIMMISSELPEILGMSNRIIIMHEGRITGTLSKQEATEEKIMAYATKTN